MAVAPASAPAANLGFLSVVQEPGGFVGGFLVTNGWGRPLEFRLSSAVQPNKVQQILYGDTLAAYVCGEVIGKTLLGKTATPTQLVITDTPLALDLRLRLDVPVVLWHGAGETVALPTGLLVQPGLSCHARFPEDLPVVRSHLEKLGPLDLGEPFLRVREALSEARKMGVASRASAA
jgi:hypothetical protein